MKSLLTHFKDNVLEAGCDEAGRGCLAGPVVAAAVILNPKKPIKGLDDSKKITEKTRLILQKSIYENALDYGIGIVSNVEIDEINILNASFLAMHRAIMNMNLRPEHLIIDGNRFNQFEDIPFKCIIKGDAKYQSIAAASILAKTHRDALMVQLGQKFQEYHWHNNKGYPTIKHRKAIKEFGECIYHRKSFKLLGDESQLNLFD